MKELSDGCVVSARTYYYLLDFNERDEWKYIQEKFNKTKLNDLTFYEYLDLFKYATKTDCDRLVLYKNS